MALIIENGTGLADAESVMSVTELDAYHVKWGNAGWTGTEAQKEAAARRGNRYMQGQFEHRVTGYRKSELQSLPYPRSGARYADGRYIPEGTIPREWKEGVAEASLRARAGTLPDDQDAQGAWLSELTVDVISLAYEDGGPGGAAYPALEDAVRPLLANTVAVMRM